MLKSSHLLTLGVLPFEKKMSLTSHQFAIDPENPNSHVR